MLALKPRDDVVTSQQVKAELDASPMESATLAAIRGALRDNPCFIEGPRHRWRLGTNYAAATVDTMESPRVVGFWQGFGPDELRPSGIFR